MVRLGMCRTWRSTLFPYTTLFRSAVEERQVALQELGQVLLAAAHAGRGEFGIGQQLLRLGVFQQGHGQALLVPPFRLGTRNTAYDAILGKTVTVELLGTEVGFSDEAVAEHAMDRGSLM